jgi:hypothetical protein
VLSPTHLENVASSWTQPGQFYYDRAGGSIGYIPRAGETLADLEASATTATVQELLIVNNTKNLRWEGVRFEYATWLGASESTGFIDTQSAYLCQQGEPPVTVHVSGSTNITFNSCDFAHLGGVYAVGADGGSSQIVVSNCTFRDISGGGVKLGSSGERGAPAPAVNTSVEDQDRGFLVQDSLFVGVPVEYSGANPIFAPYVADTTLAHNTIHDSSYSAICIGWGWGLTSSYVRNVNVVNNTITMPMQRLADGGCVYTNTPCFGCQIRGNYLASDPAVYGCLYHDGHAGAAGLWNDRENVFENITSHVVYSHQDHTTVTDIWYNNSDCAWLGNTTNRDVRDADGKCANVSIVNIKTNKQYTVQLSGT